MKINEKYDINRMEDDKGKEEERRRQWKLNKVRETEGF